MANARDEFEALIFARLITDFCSDPKRQMEAASFQRNSLNLSDYDAFQFMRAWRSGMLQHQGRGIYQFCENGSREQLFWSGSSTINPRPFTLWIEPVIAVGAMARLHFDFGWPHNRIGTQSEDWAFDIVAFQAQSDCEWIAGEVKKTQLEINQLLELMRGFGCDPSSEEPRSGKPRNAYKKVAALRRRQPPLFWAIGPNGFSRVFRVQYLANAHLILTEADERELRFVR